MALRRGRPGRVVRGKRAETNWARFAPTAAVGVAGSGKTLVASVVLSNPGINETVRRTRGTLFIQSDQASVFEECSGALGCIVTNDVANAVGVTAIPGPVTDANDDAWFVWQPFSGLIAGTNATGTATMTNGPGVIRVDFDSKAMRRVEEGFSVIFMVELATPFGAEVLLSFSLLSSQT